MDENNNETLEAVEVLDKINQSFDNTTNEQTSRSSPSQIFDQQVAAFETCQNFLCGICGKNFSSNSNLKRHLLIHSDGEKNYQCSVCEKAFQRSDHAKVHQKTVHVDLRDSTTDTVICPVCGKSCKTRKALNSHVVTVHEKRFSCESCHKVFGKKCDLERHTRVHKKVKEQCSKCSGHYANVKSHLQTCASNLQSSSNSFSCSLCKLSFKTKRYLSQHMLSQHYGKRYKCTQCPLEFKHRNSRIRHLKKDHHEMP